jgi:folate-binding Fe-S cluster repair protein YgfZ
MVGDFHQRQDLPLNRGAFTVNPVDLLELENYSVLQISGTERREFLQGQFTQDIDALTTGNSVLTGWTTAKGRLLAVGQLMESNSSIYLPLHADNAAKVAHR